MNAHEAAAGFHVSLELHFLIPVEQVTGGADKNKGRIFLQIILRKTGCIRCGVYFKMMLFSQFNNSLYASRYGSVDITFSFGKDEDPGSAGTLITIGKKKTKEERTKEQLCTSHLGLFYFLWLYADIRYAAFVRHPDPCGVSLGCFICGVPIPVVLNKDQQTVVVSDHNKIVFGGLFFKIAEIVFRPDPFTFHCRVIRHQPDLADGKDG
jgi:hypothetical protein